MNLLPIMMIAGGAVCLAVTVRMLIRYGFESGYDRGYLDAARRRDAFVSAARERIDAEEREALGAEDLDAIFGEPAISRHFQKTEGRGA